MERDIAVKKLELNRIQTKRTLRSAVQTLVSGKEKIEEGKSTSSLLLEEEIEDLEEKLKELQRISVDFNKCSNFDRQACVLQRKLQGLLAEEKCLVEIRDSVDSLQPNRFKDVEILRRKMERLSTGMLERMEEEYGSMLSSATSSGSTSRRAEFPLLSSSAQLQSLLGYKASEMLALALVVIAIVLAILPSKYIVLLIFLDTFTKHSPARRETTEKLDGRLREWWFSIPAAPVLLERPEEQKKKKMIQTVV